MSSSKVITKVQKIVEINSTTSGGDTPRSQAETPRGTSEGNDAGSRPEEDY